MTLQFPVVVAGQQSQSLANFQHVATFCPFQPLELLLSCPIYTYLTEYSVQMCTITNTRRQFVGADIGSF